MAHFNGSSDPKLHFSQFKMMEESEDVIRIWYCVWITLIGELWKQRNKKFSRRGARLLRSSRYAVVSLVMGYLKGILSMFLLFWLVSRTIDMHEIDKKKG